MIKRILIAVSLAVAAFGGAFAQQRPAPLGPVSYAEQANWLCLPGRADACAVDQSATIIYSNGRTRLAEFRLPRREPDIDCFYVYPTVSKDSGLYSDMTPGPEERRVIATQFAHFAQSCRLYAPMYRQFTLTALRQAMASDEGAGALRNAPQNELGGGYADVLAAFRYYMANYNHGRGVVLIGHSQGASHLTRLVAEEFDGKPLERYLVSAILLGTTIQVPPGQPVGGTFHSIPLCQRNDQTGCVITYASFRDVLPPSRDALFGKGGPGTVAACTNPANLRTGKGQPDAYLPAYGDLNGASEPAPSWTGDSWRPVGTPFVTVQGLIETECVSNAAGSYLSVHINANPKDGRADNINGDVLNDRGLPDPAWGLHLIDVNLSMGDLIDIVARQGRSWRAP